MSEPPSREIILHLLLQNLVAVEIFQEERSYETRFSLLWFGTVCLSY